MRLALDVSASELADALGWGANNEDTLDLLCEIDRQVADVGFTEELILRLARSLRGDHESGQYEQLLEKLAKVAA